MLFIMKKSQEDINFLLVKIDKKKIQLNKIIELNEFNLRSSEVMSISHELDKLILEYIKIH